MVRDVEEILKKFEAKLERETTSVTPTGFSKEYQRFREETMPSFTRYERLCKGIGKKIKVRLKKEDEKRISSQLKTAHLELSASDTIAFSILVLLSSLVVSILIPFAVFLITGIFPFILLFLLFFFSLFLFYYTNNMPGRLAQSWRLKASSQMVPCILYVVVYMRHTSNLEKAIEFASMHLQAPLALDFKKIFYDVEIGKYSTIKESLDSYLENWRGYSPEFIESFHLIESSLYEPSEARRIEVLEKSLEIILDGVHDKMLHYVHDVRAPLTNLYMLGIVLPTLAIAILPLASALLGGAINWFHVAIFFNMIVPFFVFYLTSQVLSKRPGGYGETELLEQNPDYVKYSSRKPFYIALAFSLPIFIIGLLPLLFQTQLPAMLGLQNDFSFSLFGAEMQAFDFRDGKGPFGLLALLLSLLIPLSIALFFSISYQLKTKELIKTRRETKDFEREFSSSIFQLGNRLGDGMPAEIAFARVAESTRGTATAGFFKIVNSNIQQAGMSVEQAIFNKRRGAIIFYPSTLVKTSMQILVESVKRGLQVAARALMSISQYVKNIGKINERLRDLLADIISDMKSNMTFLAPVLTGIVVGLSTMITSIFGKLQTMLPELGAETEVGMFGTIGTLTEMFNITEMIPPYFLQIVIGIYLIEIVFILTGTLVIVESGVDKLSEKSEISGNLRGGIFLYFIVALLATLALSLLANIAVGGIGAG